MPRDGLVDASQDEGETSRGLRRDGTLVSDVCRLGSLRRAAAEQGEAAFAQYLRQTNELIKGIAVNEPERIGEREVKLRVELVYSDRNEAQIFHLERPAGGEWKIPPKRGWSQHNYG